MNAEHPLIRWMEAHDLITYFGLTFLLTFGAAAGAILTGAGWVFDVGLWGPALAAILITALTRGKLGLKELWRRLLLWRVPLRWFLIVLLGWPAISLLAAVLHARVTGQSLSLQWGSWPGLRAMLLSAPLLGLWANEEIGWRGFALPRILGRWNALFSSILLGTVWWVWHLPYFLGSDGLNPDFYPFLIFTVSLTILMTWVFNNTRGSLFVAIFTHFWVNVYDALQADMLPLADPGGEAVIEYLLLGGAAILVVALYGYRSLTRDRTNTVLLGLKTYEA